MLQQSLFLARSDQQTDPVPSVTSPTESNGFSRTDPSASKKARRKSKETDADQRVASTVPTQNRDRSKFLADSQTPVLARYAPNEVIPILDLLADYQAVDRQLAERLAKSTTAEEISRAFAAEPHACFGEAVRQLEITEQSKVAHLLNELLKRLLSHFYTLNAAQAAFELEELPPFLYQEVWKRLSPQAQQQIKEIRWILSKCLEKTLHQQKTISPDLAVLELREISPPLQKKVWEQFSLALQERHQPVPSTELTGGGQR